MKIITTIIILLVAVIAKGYIYDPNDFALEVVYYDPGDTDTMPRDWQNGQLFDNPLTALGRPTIETNGDGNAAPYNSTVPIVPTFAPYRASDVVCIANEGHLVLKFNQPVRDDENNLFGYDFIIFGNSFQQLAASQYWLNGDPANFTTLDKAVGNENGVVSISQDGNNWFTYTTDANFIEGTSEKFNEPNFIDTLYTNSTFADSFAPTLGKVYDHDYPTWWTEPTNPTLPLPPTLNKDSFRSQSLDYICTLYGESAGGTAFDISNFNLPRDANGKKWFLYVRIDNPRIEGSTSPEIDAVSDVSACGDWKHPFPVGDINKDCSVDLIDFSMLASSWLDCSWDCND